MHAIVQSYLRFDFALPSFLEAKERRRQAQGNFNPNRKKCVPLQPKKTTNTLTRSHIQITRL